MKTFLGKATWRNKPVNSHFDGRRLVVEAAKGSDFWEKTLYGFQRDSGHALLVPTEGDGSLEISFNASFRHLYDQAGLLLWKDKANWIKAGVEVSDGVPQAAVVVTRGQSDWSLRPVPAWADHEVTIRASWSDGAVIVRAKSGDESWSTLRVAPFEVTHTAKAGLYLCSPESSGLTVVFTRAHFGQTDSALHSQPH